MISLTHGSNKTWIPSLSKPSTIGWSFRMDHARRNSCSCQQSKEATIFHRWKWRRRSWDLAFASCWNTTEMMNWGILDRPRQRRIYRWTRSSTNNRQSQRLWRHSNLSNREVATQHVSSLKIQGKSFNSIREAFDEKTINSWSTMINDLLPERLFSFVRKAFQQQLPTASNLFRWKKIDSNLCQLCGSVQTNKHALNNCGSPAALTRYKSRHDHVLSILAQWITSVVKDESAVFVDLDEPTYKPLSETVRFVATRHCHQVSEQNFNTRINDLPRNQYQCVETI